MNKLLSYHTFLPGVAKEMLKKDQLSVLRAIKTSFSKEANFEELVSIQNDYFHPFIQSLPQEVLNQTADGLPKVCALFGYHVNCSYLI